ncbi:MAG: DNA repair protein RecN [Nitrospirae bacterium]|nr:DNA repair protein RecN [Nitrospirota bacterium]
MLKALRIKDFAIIDEMSLEFEKGFTVFTGETGAGKSILVDAIGTMIGGRAAAEVVRYGSDEAVVEAIFEEVTDARLLEKMAQYGIPAGGNEILIRRNISKGGKSRIYINGALTTLSMLEEICSGLVNIHGQHDQQNLLKKERHIEYLDAFGGLSGQRDRIRERYWYLNQLRARLDDLEAGVRGRKEKEELFRYQLAEIRGAGLKPDEDKGLTREREILGNAKRLSALSNEAYSLLYEDDRAILSGLGKIEETFAEISKIDARMGEGLELVRSSKAALRETAESMRRFRDEVRHDPERLEKIEERLYLIERLKKKYGPSIEEILTYQSKIEKELTGLEYSDQDIKALRGEIEEVSAKTTQEAAELSKLREKSLKTLEREIAQELALLQMENMKFSVGIERVPLSQNGIDSVEFLIANVGEEPRPLAKIASGGELSRLMLAIKSRLSAVDSVQTLIFDEVDTGIGGRVAEEVGRRLKQLAGDHQVCCVTHLPQIAAMAGTHYSVEKVMTDNRVTTGIRRLDGQGRIQEVGRMLGGKDKTKGALRYAEEMLRAGLR